MTSQLLYKTRCPACAERGADKSGDNLAVYDDGHSYCFSCGYSTGGSLSSKLGERPRRVLNVPELPDDLDTVIKDPGKSWLAKYLDFPIKVLWSDSKQSLYFPLTDLSYARRYCGTDKNVPKWINYGITKDTMIEMGKIPSDTVVLVEDPISGYKVGHTNTFAVMPIFGSHIDLQRLARLKQVGYTKIIIWLDWDKRDYVLKPSALAQAIGLKVNVIRTELDPKELDYDTITRYLRQTQSNNKS